MDDSGNVDPRPPYEPMKRWWDGTEVRVKSFTNCNFVPVNFNDEIAQKLASSITEPLGLQRGSDDARFRHSIHSSTSACRTDRNAILVSRWQEYGSMQTMISGVLKVIMHQIHPSVISLLHGLLRSFVFSGFRVLGDL